MERMEKSESGSGHARFRQTKNLPHMLGKRSNAITYGSDYEKAAALVDLAENGIGLPEEILQQENFEKSAKYYFLLTRINFLWSLNSFALILLNFMEKPLWCAYYSEYTCRDKDYFFLGQVPYLNGAKTLTYELITLLILVTHTFSPISYEGFQLYWKRRLNIVKVTFLLILVADILVYIVYLSPMTFHSLPFRIAPYIRVIFFILNTRGLRESILVLPGIFVKYLVVLALGLVFLLCSSWIAYVMFEDTDQGKTIFTSYGTTTYQMFLLFTTSNNPNVWIPAYKVARWYSLFFIIYGLLGVYFVTNLILAVVYNSFKIQLATQMSEKDCMRAKILKKAFNLLDTSQLRHLCQDQCFQLFEELNKYRTLPKISKDEYESIFHELDDSADCQISEEEFGDLCNAIAIKFRKEDTPSWFENFPTFYHSYSSEMLKRFVRSSNFRYVIAFILAVNLVAVIVETRHDIKNNPGQKFWQMIKFTFGWLYVLEIVLKVYAYGFMTYWRDSKSHTQNRFDFIVTWVIVTEETANFVSPDHGMTFLSSMDWVHFLLVVRLLRLIRLMIHVKRYRAFLSTFFTLLSSLMPYLGIIFCVMCIYCSIGIQIFGGLVNAGNSDVLKTDLADNDYLLFNFNDYPNGMVTLYNLLVMANWQVWMQSYKELTGTKWTYIYFISFYLITVLLLLNLVVAFVLEAFFAQLNHEADNDDVNDKDCGTTKRPRLPGRKTRTQNVENLLRCTLTTELAQRNLVISTRSKVSMVLYFFIISALWFAEEDPVISTRSKVSMVLYFFIISALWFAEEDPGNGELRMI